MTVMHASDPAVPATASSGEILFIDDDTRLIAHFADAVQDAGLGAHHVRGPDEALEYLLRPDTVVDVVVWDMMLAPGESFKNEDTESGLSTGRLLFPRLKMLRPDAHYILLTARGDVSFEDFDSPDTKSYVRYKTALSTQELVEFIRELLAGG
jgi:ActR/RegA family two-component response regulator